MNSFWYFIGWGHCHTLAIHESGSGFSYLKKEKGQFELVFISMYCIRGGCAMHLLMRKKFTNAYVIKTEFKKFTIFTFSAGEQAVKMRTNRVWPMYIHIYIFKWWIFGLHSCVYLLHGSTSHQCYMNCSGRHTHIARTRQTNSPKVQDLLLC